MEPLADVLIGCDALDGAGGSVVVPRDVVEIVGPDAGTFLQGQLSQDVLAIADRPAWSFLLAPTGRVDAWLRVHRPIEDRYLLEVDEGAGAIVATRLRRFLLRTDAVVADPAAWSLLQRRWGPGRGPTDVAIDAADAPAIAPGDAGSDRLLAPGDAANDGDAPIVPLASMDRHRIAHGVPRMGAELVEATIPAEAGQWVIDASVSFTKGCYTGQELVARIDSRGAQVPHPIRLLVLDDDGASEGDPVVDVDDRSKARGRLTSVAPGLSASRPPLALAPIARAVSVGDRVVVETASGSVGATVVDPGSVG